MFRAGPGWVALARPRGMSGVVMDSEPAPPSWQDLDEKALETCSTRDMTKDRLVVVEQLVYDLARSASLDAVGRVLVERGLPALGATAAALSLLDSDGATLEVVAAVGMPAEWLGAAESLRMSARVPATEAVAIEHPVVALHPEETRARYPDLGLADDHPALVAGFPLRVDGEVVGAVSACWELRLADPDVLDLAAGQRLADVAGSQAHHQQLLDSLHRTTQQLQHALETRVLIEQAKGHLAERHGITAMEAFDRLRRYSRNHNAGLRDTAARVAGGELELGGSTGW